MTMFQHRLKCAFVCFILTTLVPFSYGVGPKPFTLVIDPGHGGEDPGASGTKTHEKDIVLAVGLKFGKLVEANLPDVKIIYTRSTDVFIPLHERADIANRNNADLFISIHANANKNHTIFGLETYSMGLHTDEKNMEVAKKENAVITFEKDYSSHYEGYDPNSAESFIIFSLMQTTYLDQSVGFAGMVQHFAEQSSRLNRGIKQAGFLVLWKTTMPSVLIETGFITNVEEEHFLSSEAGQLKLAQAIFKAFVDYKKKVDAKSNLAVKNEQNTDSQNVITKSESKSVVGQPASDTLLYAVQILTSDKRVKTNEKQFKACQKIKGKYDIKEFSGKGNFKYVIGVNASYNQVVEYAKLVKKAYPKAFVVAIRNGKIISVKEAANKDK